MSNPAASLEPYRRRLLGLAYRMRDGWWELSVFQGIPPITE
jgi:hypothetical protein